MSRCIPSYQTGIKNYKIMSYFLFRLNIHVIWRFGLEMFLKFSLLELDREKRGWGNRKRKDKWASETRSACV